MILTYPKEHIPKGTLWFTWVAWLCDGYIDLYKHAVLKQESLSLNMINLKYIWSFRLTIPYIYFGLNSHSTASLDISSFKIQLVFIISDMLQIIYGLSIA